MEQSFYFLGEIVVENCISSVVLSLSSSKFSCELERTSILPPWFVCLPYIRNNSLYYKNKERRKSISPVENDSDRNGLLDGSWSLYRWSGLGGLCLVIMWTSLRGWRANRCAGICLFRCSWNSCRVLRYERCGSTFFPAIEERTRWSADRGKQVRIQWYWLLFLFFECSTNSINFLRLGRVVILLAISRRVERIRSSVSHLLRSIWINYICRSNSW